MSGLHANIARILLSEETIQSRVTELAGEINRDYAEAQQVDLIGILKGAFIFLADLSRRLTIPHTVDFMAVSSYAASTTSGEVRILMDPREPIEDRHVLIVEDIVDSGLTLRYLLRTLGGRQPASLRTCVLLRKRGRQIEAPIDYLGFVIPDVWVVGYGLDFADTHRTLPYIAELKEEVYAR
jgi:hypoxanthine phosphoribosyltransferase